MVGNFKKIFLNNLLNLLIDDSSLICTLMDIILSTQLLSTGCNQTRCSIRKTASTIWPSSGVLFGTYMLASYFNIIQNHLPHAHAYASDTQL